MRRPADPKRDSHDASTLAEPALGASETVVSTPSQHTLRLADAIARRIARAQLDASPSTLTIVDPHAAREKVFDLEPVHLSEDGAPSHLVTETLELPLPDEVEDFETRYPLRRVLGVGGMGEVQLRHDERIGRDVAVKVLRTDAPDPVAQQRFLREARVQGQLEHPSVVPVYDVARSADGLPYFTMKRVRGRTLEQVLARLREGDARTQAQFNRRRLLTAFTSLCLAVDFAHARGVIHRDIKPANVMFGDFGEVHVLDWGVARLLDATNTEPPGARERAASGTSVDAPPSAAPHDDLLDDEDDPDVGAPTSAWRAGPVRDAPHGVSTPNLTMDGALLGTPGYMSPEQAQGHLERIDARSDVYSLGVILYEMLAGRSMHRGTSLVQVLVSTLAGTAPPPSTHDASVPPELDAICMRATALAPDARYPSARSLSEAIERYLDGDRDATLRRELAERHLESARVLLGRAQDRGTDDAVADDARLEAVREASRALAFDPEHDEARGLLATLLLEPPRRVPRELALEFDALEHEARRAGGRAGALRHVMWLSLAPFMFWMGVRNLSLVVFGLSCVGVAALIGAWMHRTGRATIGWSALLLVLSTLSMSIMSGMLSPYIVVPALAATNAMFYSLYVSARWRYAVVTICSLGVLAPWLLEVAGVVPPSFVFEHGRLVLLPRLVDLPPFAVQAFLVFVHVALVVTPSLLIGRVRDELRSAEHTVLLRSWQLRQLLPANRRKKPGAS